jgi:hypothetical protein
VVGWRGEWVNEARERKRGGEVIQIATVILALPLRTRCDPIHGCEPRVRDSCVRGEEQEQERVIGTKIDDDDWWRRATLKCSLPLYFFSFPPYLSGLFARNDGSLFVGRRAGAA